MRQVFAVLISIIIIILPVKVYASPAEDVSLGVAGVTVSNGKISPLNKGKRAPFSGVLLDPVAVAQVLTDKETAKEKCEIETEKEVSLATAKLELDLENLRAARDSAKQELEARVKLKEEHIEFLQKEAVNNAKKASNSKWWLIGGIAIGIALTVGGAFVIREIKGNQNIVIYDYTQ